MTLWRTIQKQSGKSVKECAKELKIAPSTLYSYLKGIKPAPYYVQIYFLRLRGLEIDLINANYLEDRIKEMRKWEKLFLVL